MTSSPRVVRLLPRFDWGASASVWSVPLLVFAAYAVSLFYLGFNIQVFSVVYVLLTAAAVRGLWNAYPANLVVPATPLTVILAVYWIWMAVTLWWCAVSFVGIVTWWWLGALPLGYFLYVLMPQRAQVLPVLAGAVLLSGLALAVTGAYQVLVLRAQAQAVFLDVNIQAALLNLIALPTAGYCLTRYHRTRRLDRHVFLLGLAFFVLVYAVMLTRSRGGILSLLLGAALLWVLVFRYLPFKILVSPPLALLAAFLLAGWQPDSTGGNLIAARFETLTDLRGASPERLFIWQRSWELLQQAPVRGIGIGQYSTVWPLYRHPEDSSAGFFVHNDYLQTWIEAGLPGLLLFLGVLAVSAWGVVRAWRRRDLPTRARLEIGGLAAGAVAIAVHSLVQYNFYVIPILILYGLLLARLQELAAAPRRLKTWKLSLARHFTPRGFRLVVLAVALLPIGYFTSVWASAHALANGYTLAREVSYADADLAFERSHRFWPDSDIPLVSRADLYRLALAGTRSEDIDKRAAVFRSAVDMLAQAEVRNPLRPTLFLVRAELIREVPEFAGPDWTAQAEHAYSRALHLNPRYINARYNYAKFILDRGEPSRARRIAEEGMLFTYPDREFLVPYLALTAWLRTQTGDDAGAKSLYERIARIRRIETTRLTPVSRPGRAP